MTQLADAPVMKAVPKMKTADPKQAYLDAHAIFTSTADGPSWLVDLRQHAIHSFEKVGLPSPKAEAWRWTKHRAVTSTAFAPAEMNEPAARPIAASFSFADEAVVEVVIVDGRFSRALSRLGALPEGVEVLDLIGAAQSNQQDVQPHLARLANVEKNPFVALNTAFMPGGVFVHVPTGAKLDKPIHLLFVTTGGQSRAATRPRSGNTDSPPCAEKRAPMACSRTLIVAGGNAHFSIVETYAGTEGGTYFTNAVTEIIAGDDCHIDHNKLNAESRAAYHVATMEVSIGARTVFVDHSCTIGGRTTRNDLNVHLAGEAADATLNGVVLLDGDQHCDNHTLLDHQFSNCPSYELYKHVLDERASGVFKGQIFVHRPAQKTNAVQNSRSLLLSDTATMNSQPALEIYADDVKCTHGSTTGPLDEGAVFYLNSRGVSTEVARRLLTYAFAADVTRRIKIAPVRERVEGYMARQHGLPTDFRIQDLAEATEDVVF